MRFKIQHSTHYSYSEDVRLGPQHLRFHPRDDGTQRILAYQLQISPKPLGREDQLDMEGNRVTSIWFGGKTDHLEIKLSMEVETQRDNPFNFILAPGAIEMPIDYKQDDHLAQAYLERIETDGAVSTFASGLAQEAGGVSLQFLDSLNRQIFDDFRHLYRETGAPQSPAETLETRRGACRDLTVLFVDCCRSQGIAARFASGYQKGDLAAERRHLHAWPEVYLPGAGWRGYDPTHGEPIADTHVTIAAAAHPRDTMPVIGSFIGPSATSKLSYAVQIQVTED